MATKKSKALLEWRAKQKRGAIMKPETFEEIVEKAKKKGLSEERAKRVAGKAYWRAAERKYKEAKKKKSR